MNNRQQFILIRIICSAVLLIAGFVLSFFPITDFISLYMYIAAAMLVGYDVIISAVNGVVHGHMLDENFLMVMGSICAFVLGEHAEGTFILLFYQVGELFQAIAVGKSRKSIAELMDIRPDSANLIIDGVVTTVDPYDVKVDDIIVVEPGEKIPLDGIVTEGESSLDTSSLTGEALPLDVFAGSDVISGSINLTSPIKIRITKEFEESTVSKILELVENASTRKAKAENFVTTFAKYYTPAVVVAAILIAVLPPLLFAQPLSMWILRAVMFIVISCPCALVVSVPLAFFGALGGASREGMLVKGSNYLEVLANADTIIFDKTGTLTQGSFRVDELHTAQGITEEELLFTAAVCEKHSFHPIALSIKEAYGKEIPENGTYQSISGKGIMLGTKDKTLLAGTASLLTDNGYSVPDISTKFTVVHVADGRYLGYILLCDNLKDNAAQTTEELKKLNVRKLSMLTGDRFSVAQSVAERLGLDEFSAELLPDGKVHAAEELISQAKGSVVFVGDGINDAPVLSRVDLGIAMGALGSDAACDAADIVIMNDDLSLIPKGIKIARKALRISKQNIAVSLIIKFSFLILSFLGISNILMAVFADVGVLIIAILNSMRTLSKIK